MRWTAALSFVGALLFAACTSLSSASAVLAQNPTLDQPFTLKPAASASVGSDHVEVTFERVTSDSRCPGDVQCIQAGEAVVRASVTAPGTGREPVELSTTPRGDAVTVGNYTLKLTALEPVPLSTRPTREADYRATFVLSGR